MSTQTDSDLEQEIRSTALRPLADKFGELTRQIDSGEYRLPKTIKEAEAITERYIDQAWERIAALIEADRRKSVIRELRDLDDDYQTTSQELEWLEFGYTQPCIPCKPIWERISDLEDELKAQLSSPNTNDREEKTL